MRRFGNELNEAAQEMVGRSGVISTAAYDPVRRGGRGEGPACFAWFDRQAPRIFLQAPRRALLPPCQHELVAL